MTSRVSRRSLLSRGLFAASSALGRSSAAQLASRAERSILTATPPEALVFVRLRGGADGLSLLVPHADEHYRRARPKTAIRFPDPLQASELELERGFALHPRLSPL
ncbi:MAG TPA: hypothetical protein VEQ59_16770, partial [Polyangiaceae bacterium]|nr:hypothetical protein [Polyangiaceae bacterium]